MHHPRLQYSPIGHPRTPNGSEMTPQIAPKSTLGAPRALTGAPKAADVAPQHQKSRKNDKNAQIYSKTCCPAQTMPSKQHSYNFPSKFNYHYRSKTHITV